MREDAFLASGEPGRTKVSGSQRLQWALVGGQVALSVTLLMGAGLLVRSFHALTRVEPGFEKLGVLTFRMSGSWNETADYPALLARVDLAIDTLGALPGVEGAATTGWALPGTPTQWEASFGVVEAGGDADRRIVTDLRVVSPEYFATMRIPLLQGERCGRRPVGPRGTPSGQGFDRMVNRAFVERHLSDFPSAVGLHLQAYGDAALEGAGGAGRIVGVVGDAREQGIDRVPAPIVYSCLSAPGPTPFFLVRTSGDPLALVAAVRARMKELEPQRSVYDIAVLDERIDDAYGLRRLLALLLVAFSLSALSLASVGLYGTLSYVVGLRRREVGLRMALGALRADIVRQFLAQGLRVVGLACAGGAFLALALRRVLAGLLYGVSATDAATLLGVVALVAVVAVLASLVPALRAARLDPMRVLRES
jgi:predicted permease